MEGPLKSQTVRRYSRAGKHHASFIKLINSLIAFTIMGAVGFAMLPSFLLPGSGYVNASKELKSNAQANKLSTIKKNRDCNIHSRTNTNLSAGSGVTKTVVFHDYDGKKPIKRGSTS